MTKTVEELQAEVLKLNDKVAQLIGEKRKVQSERDELLQSVQALKTDNAEHKDRLEYLTVHAPRMDMLESVAANGMADLLLREIKHNFDIAEGDVLTTKEGEPLKVEGKPVTLSVEGIAMLSEHKLMNGIGSMLKGSGASGGGALGGSSTGFAQTTNNDKPKQHFGMR